MCVQWYIELLIDFDSIVSSVCPHAVTFTLTFCQKQQAPHKRREINNGTGSLIITPKIIKGFSSFPLLSFGPFPILNRTFW